MHRTSQNTALLPLVESIILMWRTPLHVLAIINIKSSWWLKINVRYSHRYSLWA